MLQWLYAAIFFQKWYRERRSCLNLQPLWRLGILSKDQRYYHKILHQNCSQFVNPVSVEEFDVFKPILAQLNEDKNSLLKLVNFLLSFFSLEIYTKQG